MSGKIKLLIFFLLIIVLFLLRAITNMIDLTVNNQSTTDLKFLPSYDSEFVVLPQSMILPRKAFCIDGSPPAYNIKLSQVPTMKKWILHLESGAWCSSVRDCESRSKTRLGSSKFEAKTRRLQGLMSSDPKRNPDFYQWNIVEFLYCDGSSFSGNLSKPINYLGKDLYLRGAVIFEIIVEHLLKNTNIGKADLVLLTGSSAGGLASLLHADHLRQILPKTVTTVKNVVDGSLFLDQKSTTDTHLMKNMLKNTFELHNIKDSLFLRQCTDKRAETDKWQCFMPEVFIKYTQTPTYYFNSYFDTWYGSSPLKVGCWFSNSPCSSKEKDVTKDLQTAIMKVTQKIFENDSNGIFLTSCICHTVINKYRFTSVVSQGITPSTALKWWLNNEPRGKKIIEVLSNQNSWKNCP